MKSKMKYEKVFQCILRENIIKKDLIEQKIKSFKIKMKKIIIKKTIVIIVFFCYNYKRKYEKSKNFLG